MSDCVEEQHTQHYRGIWFGFGRVRNKERVLLAVFEKTPKSGSSLIANSFTGADLANHNESLARKAFITKSVFDSEVAQRGRVQKGELVGVSIANVSKLRELRADVVIQHQTKSVRAFCVIDRVELGDFDAHSAVGYERGMAANIGQGQLGKVRQKIRMDLANTFSEIVDPNSFHWPQPWSILLGRIAAILRALYLVTLGLIGERVATEQ